MSDGLLGVQEAVTSILEWYGGLRSRHPHHEHDAATFIHDLGEFGYRIIPLVAASAADAFADHLETLTRLRPEERAFLRGWRGE